MAKYSRTIWNSAAQIMKVVGKTHLQISHRLIVPRSLIKDYYPAWDLVVFTNGTAEYVQGEFVAGVIDELVSRSPLKEKIK